MSLFRRIWPGAILGAAAGYFAYVIGTGADLGTLLGLDPTLLARFTFLIVSTVYVFEPELKKRKGETAAKPE